MLAALALATLAGAHWSAVVSAGDRQGAPAPVSATAAAPAEDAAEVARLVALLGSESWDEREEATRRLAQIGRAAKAALEAALSSPDAEVRYRARIVLRAPLRDVKRLLDVIASRGGGAESDAFRAIVAMGAEAIDPLAHVVATEIANDEGRHDEAVRWALTALARIASPKATAPLLALLDGRLGRFGSLYAEALEASGADEAVRGLAARLDAAEPTVRRAAIEALSAFTGSRLDVFAALEKGLLDADLDVRVAVMPGLAERAGGRRAVKDGLNDLHMRLVNGRRVVVINMGGGGLRVVDGAPLPERPAAPPTPAESAEAKATRAALEKEIEARAVQALLRALDDAHEQVQVLAVRALESIDARAALPRLRAILAEGRADERLAATIRTLAAMDDRPSIPRLTALLASERGDVIAAAATALGRMKVAEAVPALIERLLPPRAEGDAERGDGLDEAREQLDTAQASIVSALGEIGDARAFEPLAARYRAWEHMRPMICDAIGRFPGPGPRAWLLERALAVSDAPSSVIALARLDARGDEDALVDDEAAVEAALAVLASPDGAKDDALRILARRGFRPAYDAVLKIAEQGGGFQMSAIRALGEIGDARAIPVLRAFLDEARAETSTREVIMLALARLGDVDTLAKAIDESKKRLEEHGDRESPLTELGILQLYRRDYAAALECFSKIIAVSPGNNIAAYNLACTHALAGRADEALTWLERSVENGFDDVRHMDADDDLDPVRDTPRYAALKKKMLAAESALPQMGGGGIILTTEDDE